MILLQIVMVSPGNRIVKNHDSQSRNNGPSSKLQGVMLGPNLCNQTVVNLDIDAKTLHYSLLKLKYSPSIYLKHKQD